MTYPPERVMPRPLGRVVDPLPFWFVIGGHAVRCLCPYRPSRDTDFGVHDAKDLDQLLAQLSQSGTTEILERSVDTVHLRWNGINVSVFILETLVPFVEGRRLGVKGILATKLHAILDRGTRRDFFDLYVTMQTEQLGIAECLAALREVYRQPVRDALLLRALCYFDDAEREAPLSGEGKDDWATVKGYFLERVGQLLIPPGRPLSIQQRKVDVIEEGEL
jgi:hypothetical protein